MAENNHSMCVTVGEKGDGAVSLGEEDHEREKSKEMD